MRFCRRRCRRHHSSICISFGQIASSTPSQISSSTFSCRLICGRCGRLLFQSHAQRHRTHTIILFRTTNFVTYQIVTIWICDCADIGKEVAWQLAQNEMNKSYFNIFYKSSMAQQRAHIYRNHYVECTICHSAVRALLHYCWLHPIW